MAEVRYRASQPAQEEEVITEENVYDKYDEPMGFFPGQVFVDLMSSAILLAITIALAYLVPAPLTEPVDISTTSYVPRPEWFFMFYDQMLMFFPGWALIPFGGVVIPALFFIVLFAVPWLDTEPVHSPLRRPFMTIVAFLIIAVVLLNLLLALLRIANFPGGSP